jgi:signal transduction histidine kinase
MLARELHDELGGLLVAMRMDISQIRKRLGSAEDAELKTRWERVEQALAQGLELKRRVIEDLRPTLLDNMGLFTALRWLATQRSEQAQLTLETFGLDEDIELPPETAIAVFRTVQEAIANVVKHSGATRFSVQAEVSAEHLTVRVADNGRGLPAGAEGRTGSHGLKQMRFRMDSVGGSLHVSNHELPGTTIELIAPLGRPPVVAGAAA